MRVSIVQMRRMLAVEDGIVLEPWKAKGRECSNGRYKIYHQL